MDRNVQVQSLDEQNWEEGQALIAFMILMVLFDR